MGRAPQARRPDTGSRLLGRAYAAIATTRRRGSSRGTSTGSSTHSCCASHEADSPPHSSSQLGSSRPGGEDRRNATQRDHLLPRRKPGHDRRIQRRRSRHPAWYHNLRAHPDVTFAGMPMASRGRRRDRTRSTVGPGRPNLPGLCDIPTRRRQGTSNNPAHPTHTQRTKRPDHRRTPPTGRNDHMLQRLAAWSYRRRRPRADAVGCRPDRRERDRLSVGSTFSQGFSLSGTESQRAADLLQSRFPSHAGDEGQIVFARATGVSAPTLQSRMDVLFADVAKVPGVSTVVTPYTQAGAPQMSATAPSPTQRCSSNGGRPTSRPAPSTRSGLSPRPPPARSTPYGSRWAAACSRRTRDRPCRAHRHPRRHRDPAARVRLAARDGPADPDRAVRHRHRPRARRLLSHTVTDVPTSRPQLASMIGIGVGIDYALFIVTRYRAGSARRSRARARRRAGDRHRRPRRAVRRLHGRDLAPRAVPHGRRFVRGLAVGTSVTVAVVMLGVGDVAARRARLRRPQRSTNSASPAAQAARTAP